jgi:hypothetical protein
LAVAFSFGAVTHRKSMVVLSLVGACGGFFETTLSRFSIGGGVLFRCGHSSKSMVVLSLVGPRGGFFETTLPRFSIGDGVPFRGGRPEPKRKNTREFESCPEGIFFRKIGFPPRSKTNDTVSFLTDEIFWPTKRRLGIVSSRGARRGKA